jgi:hypothetical protein
VNGDYRIVSRLLVGALLAGAAVATVLLLSDSDPAESGGRALYIAIAFGFFSLTGAAGVRLATRRFQYPTHLLGHLTVILSAIAFAEVVSFTWDQSWFLGDEWRTAAQLTLTTFAVANASLLLASERPEDDIEVQVARISSLLAVVLLAILTLVEISESGPDVSFKLLGVLAVIYMAGAALIPLLRHAELELDQR